jgi:hypothetical protein
MGIIEHWNGKRWRAVTSRGRWCVVRFQPIGPGGRRVSRPWNSPPQLLETGRYRYLVYYAHSPGGQARVVADNFRVVRKSTEPGSQAR